MVPSYGPLETIQLLSETFLFAGLIFRVIWLPKLKWVTLYTHTYTHAQRCNEHANTVYGQEVINFNRRH